LEVLFFPSTHSGSSQQATFESGLSIQVFSCFGRGTRLFVAFVPRAPTHIPPPVVLESPFDSHRPFLSVQRVGEVEHFSPSISCGGGLAILSGIYYRGSRPFGRPLSFLISRHPGVPYFLLYFCLFFPLSWDSIRGGSLPVFIRFLGSRFVNHVSLASPLPFPSSEVPRVRFFSPRLRGLE